MGSTAMSMNCSLDERCVLSLPVTYDSVIWTVATEDVKTAYRLPDLRE
jgi:hypothetical protein